MHRKRAGVLGNYFFAQEMKQWPDMPNRPLAEPQPSILTYFDGGCSACRPQELERNGGWFSSAFLGQVSPIPCWRGGVLPALCACPEWSEHPVSAPGCPCVVL